MKISSLLMAKLPERRKSAIIANLKKNWYFPLSAMGFFFINVRLNLGYFLGIPIAFIAAIIISSQIPSIWAYGKKKPIWLQVVSILTAAGICWGELDAFIEALLLSPKSQALLAQYPMLLDLSKIGSILAAVDAVFFVYFFALLFWEKMLKIVSASGLFGGVTTTEWIAYGLLIVLALGMMTAVFMQTEAFYETEFTVGIVCGAIYTGDSPLLVKENAYLSLTNPENDLRQPLFAAFAAPFIGIPYLIGKLIGADATGLAILMNSVQIVMLFAAHFMLAKMMKLDSIKRICFMLLASLTYPHMLFSLMMEQYIVAYFWVAFCMYLILEEQPNRMAFYGAGGTLITSMVLLPLMPRKPPVKCFREWFMEMVRYGVGFVALMLVFCRFDVIFNLTQKISLYSYLSGYEITLMDKVFQYTEFIRDCIAAPNAGVDPTAWGHISWQLNKPTGINFIGVAILLLAVVSAIWNREKKSSLIAIGWVGFSAVILLLLGWGTTENGLVLYTLYFGWAFLMLLFQLVEKLESKLNTRFILPALSICAAVALAIINISSIKEMVHFAISYFPA